MENKYLIKIKGLPESEQTKFIFENLKENIVRLKSALLVFTIIELFVLIVTLLPNVLDLSDEHRRYYIILYLIIIPLLILFTTVIHIMGKNMKYKNVIFYRIVLNTGLMLLLIWSVCIILFGYSDGFLPNVYIIVLLSTSVIPFLNFWEIIAVIVPAQTLLTVYAIAMNPFTEDVTMPLLLDSWAFVIVAIVISSLFYKLRTNNFKKDLELKKQNDLLKRHSEIDALTDIFNRRKLDEVMEDEWKRSGRTGKPVSFLLVDLDHFKLYNDEYGHIEGDLCLRKSAAVMKSTLKRASDGIFRYGGEEFGVVLPFTPLEGAKIMAEKIRKNIENAKITHVKSKTGNLTISIGCTSRVGDRTVDYKSLYIEADKALYAAKKSGRNKIIAYEE